MVNILIADSNICFAVNLINKLSESNNNIKVCGVAKNEKETVDFINNESLNMDVVLLEIKIPIFSVKHVLDKIQNKKRISIFRI